MAALTRKLVGENGIVAAIPVSPTVIQPVSEPGELWGQSRGRYRCKIVTAIIVHVTSRHFPKPAALNPKSYLLPRPENLLKGDDIVSRNITSPQLLFELLRNLV